MGGRLVTSLTHALHFVLFAELEQQLSVMDKKLTQKNEEMNILLNYKVSKILGSQSGGEKILLLFKSSLLLSLITYALIVIQYCVILILTYSATNVVM